MIRSMSVVENTPRTFVIVPVSSIHYFEKIVDLNFCYEKFNLA